MAAARRAWGRMPESEPTGARSRRPPAREVGRRPTARYFRTARADSRPAGRRRNQTGAETPAGRARVTLPTDEQILITREVDAQRSLVWKAWTTPDLVRRWWSGHRGAMTVADSDLRVGGAWRYVMIARDGHEVAFHGEYLEIVPGERIVSTEVYEAMPAGEAVVTSGFTDVDGRTLLTLLLRSPTRDARDAVLASGMEGGVQEQMDLLEHLARSLRPPLGAGAGGEPRTA